MKLENQAHPRTGFNSNFSALFVCLCRFILTPVAYTFSLPANKAKKGNVLKLIINLPVFYDDLSNRVTVA